MTDKEKLKEIKKLADAMYYAAFNLTTDASLLRKAMNEYHQFVIHKYCKEEPVSEECIYNRTFEEKQRSCKFCSAACQARIKEPVSIWHDGCEIPKSETSILMIRKEEKDSNYPPIAGCFHGLNSRIDGKNWGYYNGFCYNDIEAPYKWAYVDDFLALEEIPPKFPLISQKKCMFTKDSYTNEDRKVLCEDCKEKCEYNKKEEPVSEDLEEAAWLYYDKNRLPIPPEWDLHKEYIDFFKAGAQWQKSKDESSTEDLEEESKKYSSCTYLEEVLSDDDKEVLKERLINTFKAGAKWQKEKDFKYIKKECERVGSCCDEDIAIEAQRRHPYYYTSDIEAYANIGFKEGAMWQKQQDQETIELAEDHAMLAGMEKMKEQMMAKAVDGDITFDYYGDGDKTYGCIAHDSFCLEDFGLKDRDKVKVIVIKEDLV